VECRNSHIGLDGKETAKLGGEIKNKLEKMDFRIPTITEDTR
jgi:hypothetical protein